MEEGSTNKIQIGFILDVPDNIGDSDFNTLVLRVDKLRHLMENTRTKMDVNLHNRNIEEMQRLLENFKIKFIEEV